MLVYMIKCDINIFEIEHGSVNSILITIAQAHMHTNDQ